MREKKIADEYFLTEVLSFFCDRTQLDSSHVWHPENESLGYSRLAEERTVSVEACPLKKQTLCEIRS